MQINCLLKILRENVLSFFAVAIKLRSKSAKCSNRIKLVKDADSNSYCRTVPLVLCSRYYTHGACRGNEHGLRRNTGRWGSSSSFLPLNSHSATAKSMLLGAHRQYSTTHSPTETKSQKMLYYLTAVVFGMVGLTYAAVPLYRTFCQATGYGGTVQRKEVLDTSLFLSLFSSEVSFTRSLLIVAPLVSFGLILQTVEEKIARHTESGTVTERCFFHLPLNLNRLFLTCVYDKLDSLLYPIVFVP